MNGIWGKEKEHNGEANWTKEVSEKVKDVSKQANMEINNQKLKMKMVPK